MFFASDAIPHPTAPRKGAISSEGGISRSPVAAPEARTGATLPASRPGAECRGAPPVRSRRSGDLSESDKMQSRLDADCSPSRRNARRRAAATRWPLRLRRAREEHLSERANSAAAPRAGRWRAERAEAEGQTEAPPGGGQERGSRSGRRARAQQVQRRTAQPGGQPTATVTTRWRRAGTTPPARLCGDRVRDLRGGRGGTARRVPEPSRQTTSDQRPASPAIRSCPPSVPEVAPWRPLTERESQPAPRAPAGGARRGRPPVRQPCPAALRTSARSKRKSMLQNSQVMVMAPSSCAMWSRSPPPKPDSTPASRAREQRQP